METLLIFAAGLICGLTVGAWLAWHLWLKKAPVKPPDVYANLIIDRALLDRIAAAEVELWLAQRGAVFDPHKAAKK